MEHTTTLLCREKAKSWTELLEEFGGENVGEGKRLHFNGVGEEDVYNPVLVKEGEKQYLAARVESRNSYWLDPTTYDPHIIFFSHQQDGWMVEKDLPVFLTSEDPFIAYIHDEQGKEIIVFGLVTTDQTLSPPGIITRFYQASRLSELHPSQAFVKVDRMKDIRLLQLKNGEIVVCGRPQGEAAGLGRISFTKLKSLEELTSEKVWSAPIIQGQVTDEVKMGSNQLYLLENGQVGVLGHVAFTDAQDGLHYAGAVWEIDPETGSSTAPRIIAQRKNFPAGATKNGYLQDVIFPGSLEDLGEGRSRLYCGLSDAEVGYIDIPYPWSTCS